MEPANGGQLTPKPIKFARSARKHRVGKANALAAMRRAGPPNVVPATDDRGRMWDSMGRHEYQLAPGADVDLETEDLRDSQDRRITTDYAERAAEYAVRETRAGRAGRPSLTGGSTHSPRVSFRLPEKTRERAERRAEAEGVSVSTLARKALEQYLAS